MFPSRMQDWSYGNKLRPFHCRYCDVAMKAEGEGPENCWICGRFMVRGAHPKVNFRVRRANSNSTFSWRSLKGVAICNWEHVPRGYQEVDGEILVDI